MDDTDKATTPEAFPFLLDNGSHEDEECECCLVELASLQPLGCRAESISDLVRPAAGLKRDDHDPTVCPARAAFARNLNDSYPQTGEGRRDLTRENWRTACALKGTASRNDGAQVVGCLLTRAFRDWWPPVLEIYAKVFREEGGEKAVAAADAIDLVVDKMREIKPTAIADLADLADRAALADLAEIVASAEISDLSAIADLADLAALADRAARASSAALDDLAGRADMDASAARAARAALASRAALDDLAGRADLAALSDRAAIAASAAIDADLGKRIRSEMSVALYDTCGEGWTWSP